MWRLLKCACWMLWVMWSVLKSAQCGMMPVMLLPTSSRWDLLHQCIISQHYGCIVYGKEQCEDCGFFKLAGLKSSKSSSSQFVVFVTCLFIPRQLSFVAQAAPLGLSVYQLMEGMEPRTEAAKYMFLQDGRQISVSELEHFRQFYQQDEAPVHIENPHLKLSISTATGLLEVRS